MQLTDQLPPLKMVVKRSLSMNAEGHRIQILKASALESIQHLSMSKSHYFYVSKWVPAVTINGNDEQISLPVSTLMWRQLTGNHSSHPFISVPATPR
jgi:hypothetical protein